MATDLWAPRPFFDADHEAFRDAVRTFVTRHVAGEMDRWEHEGIVSRDVWLEAGRQGLLGISFPEKFGGGGVEDYRFRCVVIEELQRVGAASLAVSFATQSDIAAPYLRDFGSVEQLERWLPGCSTGEHIVAIAMTEPGTGSDLQGIRTTARRDGSDWILNGSKTFISNGILADLVVVVARTDPDAGSRGFSLFVVEEGMPGFSRGRNLDKVGLHGQDTAELVFEDVRVPEANLLGEPGGGFSMLMRQLAGERMSIAYTACAGSRAALAWTLEYVRDRSAFGRRVADFQNTQFVLAECVTELDVTQAYVESLVDPLNRGELSAVDAAKAKWWGSEMHKRTVDRCLQLFGGYGYMEEYPIARAYRDTRISTIYGGTTEIMKVIIGRDLVG
ncbi:acyl-CoA dehydrogenase family protein [Sporichthya brevicatena]|uniref:Acyl-CoA dehydrogenase family protein n=1 Tax=Sporichthya brevicatena TaxID=171442 RepID=A0ABP3SEZ9_9ACTN